MPMPVSRTKKCSCIRPETSFSALALTSTSPCGVNFKALPTRLFNICFILPGSHLTKCDMVGEISAISSTSFCSARPLKLTSTSCTRLSMSVSMASNSSFPASTLEKSKMSLIMPSSDCALFRATLR